MVYPGMSSSGLVWGGREGATLTAMNCLKPAEFSRSSTEGVRGEPPNSGRPRARASWRNINRASRGSAFDMN